MIRAPQLDDPRATGRGIDFLDPDLGHTDICAINRCYDHAFLWIRRMILPYLILWQPGKPYKRKHWHANLGVTVLPPARHDRLRNICRDFVVANTSVWILRKLVAEFS